MSTPEKRAIIGDNEPTPKKVKLVTDYVCKALECMVFRLVEHDSSLPQIGPDFKPDYAHQTFGETEEISGYTGLQIAVYLSAATAQTWVDIKWAQKKYICDDLDHTVNETFSSDTVRSESEFKALLSTPAPDYTSLGGETKHTHHLKDGSEVAIQLFNLSSAHKEIKGLHARLAPLLLFFLDGAGGIDAEDPRWEILLAFNTQGGKTHVVGFSTLYNYFHFPDGTRPRLSQVFVLPPYQGQGLGSAFVATAYQLAKERGSPDLTVEDPSPELQTLRQKIELKLLSAVPWFCEQAEQLIQQAISNGSTDKGAVQNGTAEVGPLQLPKGVLDRIRDEEKIHVAEAQQVWEAYLWQHPALQTPAGRRMVRQVLKQRLHALHFSSMEKNAVGKTIQDLSADGCVFNMMRRAETGTNQSENSSNGTASVGKRNVLQVSPEDIENALTQQLEEREKDLDRITGKSRS